MSDYFGFILLFIGTLIITILNVLVKNPDQKKKFGLGVGCIVCNLLLLSLVVLGKELGPYLIWINTLLAAYASASVVVAAEAFRKINIAKAELRIPIAGKQVVVISVVLICVSLILGIWSTIKYGSVGLVLIFALGAVFTYAGLSPSEDASNSRQ